MQVIYRWAFAVAPTLCSPFPHVKSGRARAPPAYMAPAPLEVTLWRWTTSNVIWRNMPENFLNGQE